MLRSRPHSRTKTLSYAVFGVLLLSAADAFATVSQSPLSLTVGVPPNMLLTLDDSGSMRWAFAPDSMSTTYTTRRAKSSDFNPIYYNPDVIYQAPIVFNTAGVEQQLSTSFTAAWHNGYNTAVGSVNLSGANYRVSWDVPITNAPSSYSYTSTTNYAAPTGTVYRLARNPTADFSATTSRNTNGTNTVTNGSISFAITRTNTNSCTATATLAGSLSLQPAPAPAIATLRHWLNSVSPLLLYL